MPGGHGTPEKSADYWQRYRAEKLPYVERSCTDCGEPFNPHGPQQRCNPCRVAICVTCGKEFVTDKRGRKCCSRSCVGSLPDNLARIIQVKPPTPKRTRLVQHPDRRDSVEDREWRTAIFKRDDYTCQMCGERGGRLQADHIEPVALRPDLRFDLDNGRTLCVPCHKDTPTYGWRAYWMKRRQNEVSRLSQGSLFG